MNSLLFQRVSLIACVLAFIVIVLGAYVRLSDAGLGCPDWPGCFGQITAPAKAQDLSRARDAFPHHEIDSGKAWKEMIHRYFASTLGLLILLMAFLAWKNRHNSTQQIKLPFILVGLVIFQGLLGMWTVTRLVHPTIVTLHLLMGLLTLSTLFWVFIKDRQPWLEHVKKIQITSPIRLLAKFSLLVLALQVFLGGWTSTNYVALYCPDFPTCQGEWIPQTNFSEAFVFIKDSTVNYEGGSLSLDAGVTVHFMHRIGALITAITLLTLAVLIIVKSNNLVLRKLSALLLALLVTQVSLGIANVLLVLPIPIAVSHNAIAAALLLALLLINYCLSMAPKMITSPRGSS